MEERLKQNLRRMTEGSLVPIYTGPFSKIEGLLIESNWSHQTASVVGDLLIEIFFGSHSGKELLTETGLRINRVLQNEDELLICILNEDCHLKQGSSAFLSMSSDLHPSRFEPLHEPLEELFKRKRSTTVLSNDDGGGPSVLVFESGNEQKPTEFVLQLIHEATHFADLKLTKEWIKANLALLEMDQSLGDRYFKTYVRINPEGKIEIDEGFLRFFLESRAHYTELEPIKRVAQRKLFLDLYQQQSHEAMMDIKKGTPHAERVIHELKVDESNVLQRGIQIGKAFKETIDLADAEKQFAEPKALSQRLRYQ